MHSVLTIALCPFVCGMRDPLQSNHQRPARAPTDVLRPDVAYITVSQWDYELDLPFVQNVVDLSAGGYGNDPVPLLIGAKIVAKTHIAEKMQKGIGACLRARRCSMGTVQGCGLEAWPCEPEPFLNSLSNGFFPNEKSCQQDGSPVHVDGKDVPAYGTMDVMHCGRVHRLCEPGCSKKTSSVSFKIGLTEALFSSEPGAAVVRSTLEDGVITVLSWSSMLCQRISWRSTSCFGVRDRSLELTISGGQAVAFPERHSLNGLLLPSFTRVQVTLVYVYPEAIESGVSKISAGLTLRRTRRKLASKELHQQ